MKPTPDITSVVRSWLDEGATRVPERVLDAVLDLVPSTPQRRHSWLARRMPALTNPMRVAIVAAAVVVASVTAIRLLPGSGGPGSVTPTPSPTAPPIELTRTELDQTLDPGRYRVSGTFAVPFSIMFPAGWGMRSLVEGDVSFRRTLPANGAPWVNVDLPEGLFVDPCQAAGGPVDAPSTVDGVVAALTTMVGFTPGPVTDVEVGEFAGKAVTLVNSIDTDTAGCSGGPMLPMWTIRGGSEAATNGGATERLWVLDVRGTIVIIDGETFAGTPSNAIEEIGPIVDSITFE
jgi:hypothetical protein